MRLPEAVRRELRVACSTRVQSTRTRIVKWAMIVILSAIFYRSRTYWYVVFAIVFAALLVHLLYRCKTRAWSRPWGGWNDVETAYPKSQGRR